MNTGCQAEVLPDLSPAHALLSAAHQHPDRLSLIDAESERTFTLAQSAGCVRRLAWYFTTSGLSAGDRIVVCAPNSAVSYTHLDVYKRQGFGRPKNSTEP